MDAGGFLAPFYVWNNSPEFKLYVMKDGNTIYRRTSTCRQDESRDAGAHLRHGVHRLQSRWIAPEIVLVEELSGRSCARKTIRSSRVQESSEGELSGQSDDPGAGRLGPRKIRPSILSPRRQAPLGAISARSIPTQTGTPSTCTTRSPPRTKYFKRP